MQQEKFVLKPTVESSEKYANSTFGEAFFSEEHYNYSEMTKIDSLGKFSGAFVDATTGQAHLDTTKYFYSSEIFTIEDKDTTFLRTCKTTLTDTTINFVFNDDPFFSRSTGLEIIKRGSTFQSNYIVTAIPMDSSYKLPIFTVLTQNIILDKEKYEKGNNIKGKISLTIKAFYPLSNLTDTINIFGLLKTTVD